MNFSLGVIGFCPSYYQKVKAAFKQVAVFFQICKRNFGIYTALYVIQKHPKTCTHILCIPVWSSHSNTYAYAYMEKNTSV